MVKALGIAAIRSNAGFTEMLAPVNKIIPFSNVDGPGNRLAIFFQSCPFRCYYCHNPETIRMCINCGQCVATCPAQALQLTADKVVWDQNRCIGCDTCIKVCPHLSSPKVVNMSVDEVLSQVIKARPFIQGITVSGGECTNHAAFLTELFKAVQALNLTTFIDTNGHHDLRKLPELIACTDQVMLDVKAYDAEYHRFMTGQSNDNVLINLNYLLKINKLYEVRTVLLHDQQQNIQTVSHVAELIQDRCYYKLIKYRPFGVRQAGLSICGETIVDDQQLQAMSELAQKHGAARIIAI
ncbi:putative glycyl-radical enzyme activating enzyme YjjW [bioreactor metagenome]|uniref:Putative glycyl-radical enzyme activating enzyme YjjW n=1 Tax=bioreactor metagenome TaxID=1076179 RepID=A0A645AAF7_9ZZZZ